MSNQSPQRWSWAKRSLIVAAILAVAGVSLAAFGGRMLVSVDPLPPRADAAVVLGGSYQADMARLGEGKRLLAEGRVDHLLISVGAVNWYGVWLPDLVRDFVVQEYDEQTASRVSVCAFLSDSTREEAAGLERCIDRRGWQSVIVVTSDYHTRRAGSIWRRTLAERSPEVALAVHGVPDGDFAVHGWWRDRRHAKTWLLETTKLCWWMLESFYPLPEKHG